MKNIVIIMIIFFFSPALYAFDWQSNNITVVDTKTEEKKITETLKDEQGNTFVVEYDEKLADEKGKAVLKLKKDFFEMKSLKINSVRFIVSESRIEIVVLPSKYEYRNTNILPYLPAGMLFIYSDSLEYNFRITKDNLFVRITGIYNNEDLLNEKILEAIKNPLAYIRKRDPEYFLEKIEQLEELNNILRYAVLTFNNRGFFGGFNPIKKETIMRVVEIKKQNPKFKAEDIKKDLEKEKIEISEKEISLILGVYFNEFEK